jgi:mono/diheme cytochrome c family protein
VQDLLLKGAGPDMKAPKGQTALMTAAYLGDLSTVNLLLEKGAQVNLRDDQGHMSLHLAAQNGHANVVMALLKGGADLNAVTTAGRTAALFAAQNDHAYLLRDLVQAGARFVPLTETERDIFASALVAQTIAEDAIKQKDIPRSREHYKLASEWFEKAATAYEGAAKSADNKLLAKRLLIGAALVVGEVALAVLGDMAQRQQANFQNKQMAQMAALNDAHADGTGTQGYFSRVREYENAYQKAYWSVPTHGSVSGPTLWIPPTQLFFAEEQLRDLYRNTGHQAHEAAQKNASRQNCLKSPAQEAEVTSCLRGIAADSFGPNAMVNERPLQQTSKPPIELDAAAAVKGRVIFAGKGACFNCHGKTGKGDGSVAHILNPKPTDLTNKSGLKYQTDVERFNVMKSGIPGTSMVEMNHLSDEELWLIVAYLKQLAE